MERPSGGHRRTKGNQVRTSGADTDRINSLPSNIVEHILGFLPLQDAARTSILSRHWRLKWVLLPHLILDANFFNVLPKLAMRTGTPDNLLAYSKIVNNVLLRHIGHIHKFVLYIPRWFQESTDISQWVQFVSTNGVKEFTLNMNDDGKPEKMLPSCLFSSVGLTHLTLVNCCMLSLPPMFSGFPYLISLELHSPQRWHRIKMNTLQILISSCPQLESLDLFLFELVTNLTIEAPKLQKLVVDGLVRNISLKRTTNIKTLSLGAVWLLKEGVGEFFYCLPNVETLVISNIFCKGWHSQDAPLKKVANELGCLKVLRLVQIPLNCLQIISVAFSLIRNAPQLQELHIKVSNCGYCRDLHNHTTEDFSLQCLKKVELVCISDSTYHLQLIELLLACSPALEVMMIELSKEMGGAEVKLNIAMKVMRYRRASSNAEIIFKC